MIGPSYTNAQVAKFWRFVDVGSADVCWLWNRATPGAGYGEFSAGGVRIKAHRAAYIIEHGGIPAGLFIDHICRNRACVNPAHLRAVTPRINSIENSTSFAAMNAAKTHCPNGHALVGTNLVASAPTRKCRLCFRERTNLKRRLQRQGSLFGSEAA